MLNNFRSYENETAKYPRINQKDMLDIILPLLADDTKHETNSKQNNVCRII